MGITVPGHTIVTLLSYLAADILYVVVDPRGHIRMNAPAESHEVYSESYSQRIWRHFQADSFARNGFRMIIALFVIAALAPFLANSHAIIRIADGRASFPIFATMEPIEWRFLLYLPLAGMVYLLRKRFTHHFGRSMLCLVGIVVLIEIFMVILHPVNDPTNDRDRP